MIYHSTVTLRCPRCGWPFETDREQYNTFAQCASAEIVCAWCYAKAKRESDKAWETRQCKNP